jgi:hypothetical protein
MIIARPHTLTKLEVWSPRYSDAYKEGERVALLACYKVDNASPVILIEFTRAKHLIGGRFCIERKKAQGFRRDSNGKIPCYCVKMSALETWETPGETMEIAEQLWPTNL